MTNPSLPSRRPAMPVIAIDGIRASLLPHEIPGVKGYIPPSRVAPDTNTDTAVVRQTHDVTDVQLGDVQLDSSEATTPEETAECSTGAGETTNVASPEVGGSDGTKVRKQTDTEQASNSKGVKRPKVARSYTPPEPWETWFELLVEFKRKNGHTRVPKGYVDGVSGRRLGNWVSYQRHHFSTKPRCLTDDRIKMLNSVGFDWTLDTAWETWFGLLVDYREKNGHTRVPKAYVDASSGQRLGTWVAMQRQYFSKKQRRLTDDRIEMLKSIGFEWSVNSTSPWESWFELLEEFKRKNGHTRVPTKYVDAKSGQKLGTWVINQRAHFWKKEKGLPSPLTDDRIEMLNSVAFEWSLKGRSVARVKWSLRPVDLARSTGDGRDCIRHETSEKDSLVGSNGEPIGMIREEGPWRCHVQYGAR